MGNSGSSDVTSTVAICPRSIQCTPGGDAATVWTELTILFRTFLFSLKESIDGKAFGCERASRAVGVRRAIMTTTRTTLIPGAAILGMIALSTQGVRA
jgi:hypothetical protein